MNKYAERVRQLKGKAHSAVYEDELLQLTEANLQHVERELGHPLPADYREFVRDYGGVDFLHGVTFPVNHFCEGSLELFYGVAPDDLAVGLVDSYYQRRDSFVRWPIELVPGAKLVRNMNESTREIAWPTELLPIGMDAGNNQICLSLAGLRTGAVFLWLNAPSYGDQNVYLVADSFDEFMQSLYLRDSASD